ncbi:hypothetical protein HZS61_000524 [Fusarium oxysporum f. sp. conglutinans]|uniref:Uncharacterized protein n=1 Tax=Fusarium oxysporum f. sp. conglutinans TaxID=100902 RepID=A0A8H6H2Q3_FUSOX|nr:hypothetical protein HZS61_000524 [Fusarium oxysporum f. sp. conglutinans]
MSDWICRGLDVWCFHPLQPSNLSVFICLSNLSIAQFDLCPSPACPGIDPSPSPVRPGFGGGGGPWIA